MQIIAGSKNELLASKIAQSNNAQLLNYQLEKYPDSELKVQIFDEVTESVMVVKSISYPVNDSLMELLLIVDGCKRAGAKNITALVPYLGYSRQDRIYSQSAPLAISLVAKLLESAGVNRLITLDLHNANIEKHFSIPVININSEDIFQIAYGKEKLLIAPDQGAQARVQQFADKLNIPMIVCGKERDAQGKSIVKYIEGEVRGKECIIIDDIVDSAGTLCSVAMALQEHGAKIVRAYVTHAVLSPGAIEKINNSCIEEIYVTNSIPIEKNSLPLKFKIVPIDELFIPDTTVFPRK